MHFLPGVILGMVPWDEHPSCKHYGSIPQEAGTTRRHPAEGTQSSGLGGSAQLGDTSLLKTQPNKAALQGQSWVGHPKKMVSR